MRKHFYLITEHDDADRVGGIMIMDRRHSRAEKNNPGPLQAFDEEKGEFYTKGQAVGLGYHDFEDEADYEARVNDVIHRKLGVVDEEYLKQAGHDPAEVTA
jgi:hypothetical protein